MLRARIKAEHENKQDSPCIADHGYIERLFVENWRYEFGAADAMRNELTDRLGTSAARSKTYEFGEMITAV